MKIGDGVCGSLWRFGTSVGAIALQQLAPTMYNTIPSQMKRRCGHENMMIRPHTLRRSKVKGHLASLLNDALVRIKMLEQELRLEKMKNGSIVPSSHSTPGREVYISPRHYEDVLGSSGANSTSTPRTKKKLLGPFSPQGGGIYTVSKQHGVGRRTAKWWQAAL